MIEATSRHAVNNVSMRSAAVPSWSPGAGQVRRHRAGARVVGAAHSADLQQHHTQVYRKLLADGPQLGRQPHRGVAQQDRDAPRRSRRPPSTPRRGYPPPTPVTTEPQRPAWRLSTCETQLLIRDDARPLDVLAVSRSAPYVSTSVTIRYDPRDLSEIRAFHRDRFLCRAINPEPAEIPSPKDIQTARVAYRCALRGQLAIRRATVADTFRGWTCKRTGTHAKPVRACRSGYSPVGLRGSLACVPVRCQPVHDLDLRAGLVASAIGTTAQQQPKTAYDTNQTRRRAGFRVTQRHGGRDQRRPLRRSHSHFKANNSKIF